MRVCVAQTRSVRGDIQSNLENHLKIIETAVSDGANILIFPELSITGYEPELAKDLATHSDDSRFERFQKIADSEQIAIGVGVPTKSARGVCISMVIFYPKQSRQVYSKKYIHSDEEPFFVSGQNSTGFMQTRGRIALSICYELSVPEHAEAAAKNGAKVYIASAAKSKDGVEKAAKRLSKIAKDQAMTVLLSNCVGPCEGFEGAGRSAIWSREGLLLGQLDSQNQGILTIDLDTGSTVQTVLT